MYAYLNTKGIVFSKNPCENRGNYECYHMVEADHFLKSMDGVLNYLFDNNCEPKCIELRHEIAKSCEESKTLAN